MAYLIKCKHCGHDQKFLPITKVTLKSVKKCVYCGKLIKVAEQMIRRIA